MNDVNTNHTAAGKGGSAFKIGIVVLLAVAVGAVVYAKRQPEDAVAEAGGGADFDVATASEAQDPAAVTPEQTEKLPRLLDLGADKCVPCKMMAPILEEVKEEYAGKVEVQFIDVWKNEGAGREYGIRVIPTQIFFDASGEELFRHEGFMSKEDILKKFCDLKIDCGEVEVKEST